MQSMKKIGQQMLKIEPGNETDGQTDGQTDGHSNAKFFGGYNIIPRTFLSGGV